MKTKGKGLAVALIVMMLVAMPALASLNNSSNSSVNESETLNDNITNPVPEPETPTPTPSPPDEESDNNSNTTTDTDTEANADETEIIDDEIPLLSENVKIIGKDSFSANETPEFVIEIEQAFIDAVASVNDGKSVEVQISVEGCNGTGIELFVEEEEASPSSNISIYRVTIPNNKTGTEEITPGTYMLVVKVGEQSVEHTFEWGLEPESEPTNITVSKSGDVVYDSTSTSKPVIIMFKDKSDAELIKQHGGKIKSAYRLKPALAASLPQKAIDALRNNPKIDFVVDDLQIFAMGETLDWGVDRIDADVVHESNNNGTGINVAVLDTGIDYNHPDLAANYEGGYDFGGGYSGAPNDADPMDFNGHGTHCAGIVAAVKGNGVGVIGVAPEADLYAVKVFSDDGYGRYSDIAEALEWCIDTRTDGNPNNDIQVISMSFGSKYSAGDPRIESWINATFDAGILLVGAAGNDGNPGGSGDSVGYPARYESVIAVAATDINDNRASFSSTGPAVELVAPGVSIYSTCRDDTYVTMSGTSMACPMVSGTASLVIASNSSLTNVDVRMRLQETAEDLGVAGKDTKYGYGLVNASEAASPTGLPDEYECPVVATPKTYDNTTMEEKTVFERNDSMFINVSVTDADGASDLDSVLITILNTTNATIVNNDTMTQDTPITNGYVYNYSWKVPGDAESGTWTLKVYANDTLGNVGSASVQFVVNITNATIPENKNITVDLIAMKKHFALNENPKFKFIVNCNITVGESKANETGLKVLAIGEQKPNAKHFSVNAFSKRVGLKTLATPTETIKTSVYYKDKLLDIEPEIEKMGEGDFSIKIPSKRAFRAGLYTLKVELVKDNKSYVEEQDFTWGVLAINTHKSIYLSGETAFIGIAVLDDEGHMVCDAAITLTITDTSSKETVLSTSNGLVKVSPECSVYGVTNLPDYYTNYTVGGVGTYVMNLTAVTSAGVYSIRDNFSVQSSVDFDVAREGPTRIYPIVPYRMNFTIKANKNYNGLINEYVPASFAITPQEGLTVTTVGDIKILSWNKNLVEGETYNVYYEFDAPDISPYLFVLGDLEIGDWHEARQWMIASDAQTGGCQCKTVASGIIHGGIYDESYGSYCAGEKYTDENGHIYWKVTHTFENVPSNIKVARVRTGCWGGSPCNGGDGFNITINDYTSANYNAIDPCSYPERCDVLNWSNNSNPSSITGVCQADTTGCGQTYIRYNATPYIVPGSNTITMIQRRATVNPKDWGGAWAGWHGWGAAYGIFNLKLFVVYENAGMPEMHYFINEGTTLIVKGSGCEPDSSESFIYFNGSKVYTGSARKVTLKYPAPGATGVSYFNGHNLTGGWPWEDIPPGYLVPSNNLFYYYDDTMPESGKQIFDRTIWTRMIIEYERSDLTVTNISALTLYANYYNTINATVLNNVGNVYSNTTGFNVTLYANGSKVDVQHVSSIGEGESKEVSFTWKPTSEGAYELNVTADVEDIVLETNEANNTKTEIVNVEPAPVPIWRNQSSNVNSIPVGGSIELRAQGSAKHGLDYAVLWTDETGTWMGCNNYGSPMEMFSLQSDSFTHTSDADWNAQTRENLAVAAGDVKLLWTEAGGNIALSKPSYASSYEYCEGPGDGNDGDDGYTYWYAVCPADYTYDWWYVDLGEIKNVGKIVIKDVCYLGIHGHYDIQISDDASSWTTKKADQTNEGLVTFDGLDWSCRYVRFYVEHNEGAGFAEFEVFGKAGYKSSGLLTSTATSTGNLIVSVTPTWNSDAPAGTSLSVNVSVDNGATWKPATNGTELTWDYDTLNKNLKYKVGFETSDTTKTPVLHDITLNYKTKDAPKETWMWSNFTWQNDSITDKTVSWKICYNDTVGETTCTDVMTFDVFAPDITSPYTEGHDPVPDATGVPRNTNITVHVKDDGEGVDESTLVMKVDGSIVTPVISGSPADYTLVYDPTDFDFWQVVHVTVDASDLASPPNDMITDSYSFTVVGDKPDLIIKNIDAYHNATGYPPYFNLSNEVDVVIENVGGVASGVSNVSLYINGSFVGKTDVPGLDVLSNTTAQFKWTPSGCDCEDGCSPDTFILKAIADCDNAITELNESNNASTTEETAYWNGYSADEPLVEVQHGTIHGGLNFTTGDGSYTSLTTHGSSKDIHYNLTLPAGATVALARLNVYYLWSKYGYPIMAVNVTNQTGTHTVPLDKSYNDRPCSSPGVTSNNPSGNYVYNVTPYITGSGDYTVTVKNNGNETNPSDFAIYAPGLVILYEDDTKPEYEYWILEGADMLEGGRKSGSGNLALAECINNATLPGIDKSGVETAVIGLVTPAGDGTGSDSYLYFNGNEIGTDVYHGHSSQYSKTLNGIAMHIGSTDAQVGVNISDVKEYFDASSNIVGQGDNGDSMVVANVFLLVESTSIGDAPTVDSITITPDDDGATAGVQINPVPNSTKTVTVTAQVSDPNGYGDISTVKITDIVPDPTSGDPSPVTLNFISGSGTTATYEGTFDMQFYDTSTTYTVTVTATDGGGLTGSNSSPFEYQTCIALELDTTSIAFGSAGPDESSEVTGDTVFPNAAPTIKNSGNVVIDMRISGTDMSGSSGTIPVNNIADDLNNPDGYTALSTTPTEHDELNLTVGASSVHGIDFKLNVPSGTSAGDYSGTVTLEAKMDD